MVEITAIATHASILILLMNIKIIFFKLLKLGDSIFRQCSFDPSSEVKRGSKMYRLSFVITQLAMRAVI